MAYENHDDLIDCAKMHGWQVGDGDDGGDLETGDLCPDCKPKPKAATPKKRGSK